MRLVTRVLVLGLSPSEVRSQLQFCRAKSTRMWQIHQFETSSNAGTAEPFRVSPPEAVAYPLELLKARLPPLIPHRLRIAKNRLRMIVVFRQGVISRDDTEDQKLGKVCGPPWQPRCSVVVPDPVGGSGIGGNEKVVEELVLDTIDAGRPIGLASDGWA